MKTRANKYYQSFSQALKYGSAKAQSNAGTLRAQAWRKTHPKRYKQQIKRWNDKQAEKRRRMSRAELLKYNRHRNAKRNAKIALGLIKKPDHWFDVNTPFYERRMLTCVNCGQEVYLYDSGHKILITVPFYKGNSLGTCKTCLNEGQEDS